MTTAFMAPTPRARQSHDDIQQLVTGVRDTYENEPQPKSAKKQRHGTALRISGLILVVLALAAYGVVTTISLGNEGSELTGIHKVVKALKKQQTAYHRQAVQNDAVVKGLAKASKNHTQTLNELTDLGNQLAALAKLTATQATSAANGSATVSQILIEAHATSVQLQQQEANICKATTGCVIVPTIG